MMASKARLFVDDLVFSVKLATDGPLKQNLLGRQVRHFDHQCWQQACENVVLRGNLANLAQNEDKRIGQHCLAETSPHDKLWGIGLSACNYRASSRGTWRDSNLLGQAVEIVRGTLYSETMPQNFDSLPPDITAPINQPSDTIFEVDPITRIRLNTAPTIEYPHNAIISAFMDSVLDDHAPKVLLTNYFRTDKPLISEHGPDLISGVVTMDDVTFTTLPSLATRASAISHIHFAPVWTQNRPDHSSNKVPLSRRKPAAPPTNPTSDRQHPDRESGIGSQELLGTNRQVRMTIQVYHSGTASLAVWIYIVPNEILRCTFLLGRNGSMRFHSRSYQTLAPTPDGRLFGELALSCAFDDACNSAAAYIRSCEAPDAAYHLVYDGPGESLNMTPQLVPVNLIRLDGSLALAEHYMVDVIPTHDGWTPYEHLIGSGRQAIPIMGYRDLKRGDSLGTDGTISLLRVPLEALAPHDVRSDVTPVAESPLPSASLSLATNVEPDTSDEPSSELVHRLDDDQRESFLCLWSTVPSHIRRIDFALDAPGWEPSAINAFNATLAEYAGIFSTSKLDYGACSHLLDTRMRLNPAVLLHPRRWLGWANPFIK